MAIQPQILIQPSLRLTTDHSIVSLRAKASKSGLTPELLLHCLVSDAGRGGETGGGVPFVGRGLQQRCRRSWYEGALLRVYIGVPRRRGDSDAAVRPRFPPELRRPVAGALPADMPALSHARRRRRCRGFGPRAAASASASTQRGPRHLDLFSLRHQQLLAVDRSMS